jgi:hypothetical protein
MSFNIVIRKKAMPLSALALGLGLAGYLPLAAAQEKGYSEIYYMHMDMEATSGGEKYSARPPAVQLRLGTTFQKYLGLEGVFAFGVNDDEFTTGVKGKFNTLFGANAVGILPLGEKADILARVGFAQMDVDVGDTSYDDTGVMYSIGFDIRVSRYGAVAMEYMQLPDIDLDAGGKLETSSINLGYRLRF